MGIKISSIGLAVLFFIGVGAGCTSGDEPKEKDLGVKSDVPPTTFKDSRPADTHPVVDKLPAADQLFDQYPTGEQGNACTAKTADGIYLNPGCDPDIQVNGVTAFSVFDPAGTASWLVMSGKKFWIYNPTIGATGEFTGGGKDISTYLKALAPLNCTDMMGGVTLNPGCDIDVQANGITAVDIVTLEDATIWIFLSGKKYWGFDPAAAAGAGAFTTASADWSTALQALGPQSCSITMEGVTLNPGCDVDVQTNGVTTLSSVTGEGNVAWMLTSGKKFWTYDLNLSAFLTAGDNLAGFLALLNPMDCLTTTTDGLSLNPGCDTDVKANGLTATGSLTAAGNTVWWMSSGKKYWIFDFAAQSGAGAFTAGGMDVASFFRQLKP